MDYFPIILIPICAYLNMMGGQSASGGARFIFRMLAIGVSFGVVALFSGIPTQLSFNLIYAAVAGQALWAVFKWGTGFMALESTVTDYRDYSLPIWNPSHWVTAATDKILGLDQKSTLTPKQIHLWGEVYMTIRGGFHYPVFIVFAFMLNPMALLFGFLCFLQGVIYRLSPTVKTAEIITGAIAVGLPMALTLIAYK